MKLSDLEPSFRKIVIKIETWKTRSEEGVEGEATGPRYYLHRVDTMEKADGIWFLCPLCFKNNGGNVGTHSVSCWRPRVDQSEHLTGPGRWELVGSNFDNLSLVGATTSSVQLNGGCNAHFTITNGEVIWH
jgi:hypothetical protein